MTIWASAAAQLWFRPARRSLSATPSHWGATSKRSRSGSTTCLIGADRRTTDRSLLFFFMGRAAPVEQPSLVVVVTHCPTSRYFNWIGSWRFVVTVVFLFLV